MDCVGGEGDAAGIVGGGAVLVEVLGGTATPFDVPDPEASALLVTTGGVGFFRCRISTPSKTSLRFRS